MVVFNSESFLGYLSEVTFLKLKVEMNDSKDSYEGR